MITAKNFSVIAGLLALSAVVLGAFGAHALKAQLTAHDTLATWQTAVDYQMWHALALLMISQRATESKSSHVAKYCFCAGILLFSGSLYCLSLNGPRWLGPITPIGGLLLISGWTAFVFSIIKTPKQA
jgi:uncharacterized membrane protein YgdD (TMEM256/DUF423 family)